MNKNNNSDSFKGGSAVGRTHLVLESVLKKGSVNKVCLVGELKDYRILKSRPKRMRNEGGRNFNFSSHEQEQENEFALFKVEVPREDNFSSSRDKSSSQRGRNES
jgi:hypothetical protein